MCCKLPSVLEPVLNEYTKNLLTNFKDKIYGIYIYNSVALGNFIPDKSDIDMIILLNDEFTEAELTVLKSIHCNLKNQFSYGKYMEGMYLPLQALGKYNKDLDPYVYFDNCTIRGYGHYDLNPVTWYTLKNYGIALTGPSTAYMNLNIGYKDLVKNMDYNLNTYWKEKASEKLIFLQDEWVEFAVVTLCRILYTLENKEITSKNFATEYILSNNPKYSKLLNEALRIRLNTSKTSLYTNRFSRSKEVRDFINTQIDYCNVTYLNI